MFSAIVMIFLTSIVILLIIFFSHFLMHKIMNKVSLKYFVKSIKDVYEVYLIIFISLLVVNFLICASSIGSRTYSGSSNLKIINTEHTQQIFSLTNGDNQINGQINGSLFLVRGYVETEEVYKYNVSVGDGFIKSYNAPVNLSRIKEYDGESKLVYTTQTKMSVDNKVARYFLLLSKKKFESEIIEETVTNYDFYVPKNSVVNEFNVN